MPKKSQVDYGHLCGWIPPSDRTDEQHEADALARTRMPKFSMYGSTGEPLPDKVILTQLWDSEEVQASLGFKFSGFHQLTGSCFPAGTPVQMADGSEKAIEDIKVGDEVVSHTGAKRKVVKSYRRKYTGTMHTFHVKGHRFPFTVTADHDVMIVPKVGELVRFPSQTAMVTRAGIPTKVKADTVSRREWMMMPFGLQGNEEVAFDLAQMIDDSIMVDENDASLVRTKRFYKGRGVKCNRHIKLDEKLAWLLGLYTAEGSLCRNVKKDTVNGFLLSLGAHEPILAAQAEAYTKEIFSRDLAIQVGPPAKDKLTSLQVKVYSAIVGRFIQKLIPNNQWSKRVPQEVFRCSRAVKLAYLRGWMDGDGHMQSSKNCPGRKGLSLRGVSASSELIRDMVRLCLSCGLKPSALRRKKASHQRVASMDLYLSGPDALAVYPERAVGLATAGVGTKERVKYRMPNGFAVPVEKIEEEQVENMPVYCCEVEVDHTLIVNSIAVGQCVGVGYGDVAFSTLVSEVIVAKQPHKIIVPFWPLTYGRGRARAGMRGRGEGSFGTAQADAARLDGCIDFAEPGLPAYKESEGLVIARNEELNWSDGNAIDKKWLEMAKHNIIGTTSVQDTVDGVKIGLQNYYAHTLATSMYCNPGNAKIKNGMTVGQFDTNGGHQTSLQGYMLHPENGEMFYNKNQWGNVYPLDPITGRRDGCWITKASLQWAVSQREVIAYASQTGFMARTFKWIWA